MKSYSFRSTTMRLAFARAAFGSSELAKVVRRALARSSVGIVHISKKPGV